MVFVVVRMEWAVKETERFSEVAMAGVRLAREWYVADGREQRLECVQTLRECFGDVSKRVF
jgi:hypothetical protein